MLSTSFTSPSTMESKKRLGISNLMSPPEPAPLELNQTTVSHTRRPSSSHKPVPNAPISPPVSPFAKATNAIGPAPTLSSIHDPILYPAVATSPPAQPLFTPTAELTEKAQERLIDQHIASRSNELFRNATPPEREDYMIALFFKSNVLQMCRQNPAQWLKKERELLRQDKKSASMARPLPRLPPILPAARPAVPRPQVAKVQKPKSPKVKAQAPRPLRVTPTTSRQTARVSQTPEPRTRTVAPNREDKDFMSLPDYCPPTSTLPNKANCLKVDWKGNPLDLSKDPHAHLLHDAERDLAALLRLDCATYLTSKRRIFIRRLECARIGKEFRKTDAQQACKIDVNKASKLWTAYDKVGWLDLAYMQRYLQA